MSNSTYHPDLPAVRDEIKKRLDDVSLDALCLDHFPEVYDKFGQGMRRDAKTTLLLDHCRRNPDDYRKLLERLGLVESSTPIEEEEDAGKVPVEAIHESQFRLPGEVLAIELLTRPLTLRRSKRTGRFMVIVDRRGVEYALTTTAAKTAEVKKTVVGREKELAEIDDQIHRFLLGLDPRDEFVVDLPALGIPLRWASGGVMSVVTGVVEGSQSRWTPFLFRDINPWGWNLALGSSERQFEDGRCVSQVEEELNDPSLFILREFLEETLVIKGEPISVSDRILPTKQFYFDDIHVERQRQWWNLFDREHVDRRDAEDSLVFEQRPSFEGGFGRNLVHAISAFDTKTDLLVIDRRRNRYRKNNVFVTINLLELGIEVIKVLNYHLDPDDYILDGELLVREGGETELVRMPWAFIAHEALERSFSPETFEPEWTTDIPPSLVGKPIGPTEIKFYSWDVRQRLRRMRGHNTPKLERDRYAEWHSRFGRLFDDEGNLKPNQIPRCFTPGPAKTLSLYFQRKSEQ